jgi:lipopolysaccharide assembly outer membrane protein LptD (OstA)
MAPWETELPHGEWQSALLNDTYFRIPSNINLKCRVNYHKRIDEMVFDETNRIYNFKAKEGGECRLINLKGNQDEYEKYAKASGLLKLSDGTTIHWYVLEDKKNLGFYLRRRKSRIAYVCDNENYETKYGARANFPDWNVHYCSDRIALFIELDSTIYEPDVHRRKINLIGESIHSSGRVGLSKSTNTRN